MKIKLLTAAALLMISTGLAQAAWTGEQLAKTYTDKGYTRVEVKLMAGVAKVEAFKAGAKLEVIHDIETGSVLKSEQSVARVGENTSPGVFVRDRRAEDGRRGGDDDSGRHGRGSDDDSDDSDDSYDDSDDDSGRHGRGRGSDD